MLHQDRDLQTLNFFAILGIALGLWLAVPDFVNPTIATSIQNYMPIWLLSAIFILGGLFNLFFPKRLIGYVAFVSTPIVFLGTIFFQNALLNGNLSPGAILCSAIGLYSAIFVGQILKKI